MKVLLINGSARHKGNTFLALTEIANTLEKEGIESEIVQIGAKAVRGCIACGKCSVQVAVESGVPQLPNRCVFDDDICNQISAKMKECDALVVGSPVYYGQPNGSLLSLVQRMFYSAGAYFVQKPAAAVAICRRGGATAALQTMNMPFEMMNMLVVSSQYWNIAYGRSEGEVSLDKEGMQTMRTLAKNMAYLLKATANQPRPKYETRQPMNFIREN